MIAPARVFLAFRHPQIKVVTHLQGDEFLAYCACAHAVHASLMIGKHTYRFCFEANYLKPELRLNLSKGEIGLTDLVKLSNAFTALAVLVQEMSAAVK